MLVRQATLEDLDQMTALIHATTKKLIEKHVYQWTHPCELEQLETQIKNGEVYILEDFYNPEKKSQLLVLSINGSDVEVNFYDDPEKNMFDKIINLQWNELRIPILPLDDAKRFYESIGRNEKVEMIEKFLC